MNDFFNKNSIKGKLSILVTVSVIVVVTILGFYFDSFLKKNFYERANVRILHAFNRLADNIEIIEQQLIEGISFTRSDRKTAASVELINNYQDKTNYNVYLIDEEKKLIANRLLSKIQLSFNDDIALFDKNQELVAYVTKKRGGYQLNYISYHGNKASLLTRSENQADFVLTDLRLPPNIELEHKYYYTDKQLKEGAVITYHRFDGKIYLTSHHYIFDNDPKHPIGHIEMSRILDQDYFQDLSAALDLELKYSFDPDLEDQSTGLWQSFDKKQIEVVERRKSFGAVLKMKSKNGPIYYITRLDQMTFNILLKESRIQLLTILILVLISTLLLMHYTMKRWLDRPLTKLMQQIHKIESHNYSGSNNKNTGDEIEEVSASINHLALTISERETALKSSMEEQKQLSAQNRMLLDSTAEGIYGLDMQGNCTFANPACVRILGYNNSEDLLGLNMHELIHYKKHDGELYPAEECPIYKVLKTAKGIHVDTEVHWRADGASFLADYSSYPVFQDDKISGVVVTFTDITERRKTEDSLRRAQKMEAIGQLTGGLAHDFNNILAIILGNLEMLEKQLTVNDVVRKRLDTMKNAGNKAAGLTKKLLSFSRGMPLKLEVIDINNIIREMEGLITRSLTPEIIIEYRLTDELWLTEIDIGDFENALLNLCINARDAMAGSGSLTIETKNIILDETYCKNNSVAHAGDYVELSISDNGEGITVEQQQRIFEPFYSTKDQAKGTGLGLAMVFGFIQRTEGHVSCYSKVGFGTTFTLYTPRYKATDN